MEKEGEKEEVVVEQPKRLKSFSSEHFGQTNILKLNLNSKNPTPCAALIGIIMIQKEEERKAEEEEEPSTERKEVSEDIIEMSKNKDDCRRSLGNDEMAALISSREQVRLGEEEN